MVLFMLLIGGRPKLDIQYQQLRLLMDKGFTAKKIASVLHCSHQLVYKNIYDLGLHMRDKYTRINDHELEEQIKVLHEQHPNCGSVVKSYFLNNKIVNNFFFSCICLVFHCN